MEKKKLEFNNLIEKLQLLNPLNILQKGYSITYKDDKVIKKCDEVKANDLIKIKLHDGIIDAIVKE